MAFTYPVPPKFITKITDDFADHKARGSVNPGLDFATPVGTDVYATGAGVVTLADGSPDGAGGRMVIINHGGGNTTESLHLSRVLVAVGDKVKQGQVIGKSGGSGFGKEDGYGAHLHIAVKKKGVNVDPAKLFKTKNQIAKAKAAKAAKAAAAVEAAEEV